MLVLSRKPGESIFIGDDIEIVITRIEYNEVRIAISAPKDLLIVRGELMDHVEELRERFGIRKRPAQKTLKALIQDTLQKLSF